MLFLRKVLMYKPLTIDLPHLSTFRQSELKPELKLVGIKIDVTVVYVFSITLAGQKENYPAPSKFFPTGESRFSILNVLQSFQRHNRVVARWGKVKIIRVTAQDTPASAFPRWSLGVDSRGVGPPRGQFLQKAAAATADIKNSLTDNKGKDLPPLRHSTV